jgi:hypothetical protein
MPSQAKDRDLRRYLHPFEFGLLNTLRLRSMLQQVAALGREWTPVRHVPDGSHVELSDRELNDVARAEHERRRRRRINRLPWEALAENARAEARNIVKTQVARLEDVGFLPIVPAGGPPGAADYERFGLVRASRLDEAMTWATSVGDQMHGRRGDWRVVDAANQVRTISDDEFQSSHELVGDGSWRRVGTFRAWQVDETMLVRTREGTATATPGAWIVEGPRGDRWPVGDRQFQHSYRRASASGTAGAGVRGPRGDHTRPAAARRRRTAPAISS